MSITHLIIQDEEKKRQQREDDQRPAMRIPALDRSKLPFPAPAGKPKSDRGVYITPGYDDEDDEPENRGVVITDSDRGYTF